MTEAAKKKSPEVASQELTLSEPARIVRTFLCFFVMLCSVALLSAPGATNDELFHAANILCGQGEREPYCQDIRFDVPYPGASVNFDLPTCQREATTPLECPSDQEKRSFRSINHGNLYPNLYYRLLSYVAGPTLEETIVWSRVVVALTISSLLAAMLLILPAPYSRATILVILTALPATGYFLFASINPSNFASFGVGFGWIPLHAALARRHLDRWRPVALVTLSSIFVVLAVGSRWDAAPFSALVIALAIFHALWSQKGRQRRIVVGIAGLMFLPVLWVTETFTPIHAKPSRFIQLLLNGNNHEVEGAVFVSHYMLHAIPNMLASLHTLPLTSGITLPSLVQVINVGVIFYSILRTRAISGMSQFVGSGILVSSAGLAIMAQVTLIDDRDLFGVEPRYVFPLLIAATGWWYITSNRLESSRIHNIVTSARFAIIISFVLVAYSVAERYADRQTYGVRLIPEGIDNWWWSFMPVGPNTVLILASIAFAAFVANCVQLIRGESCHPR